MKKTKHLFILTGAPRTGKTSLINLIDSRSKSKKKICHFTSLSALHMFTMLEGKDKNGNQFKYDTLVLDGISSDYLKNDHFSMNFIELMKSGYNFSYFILVTDHLFTKDMVKMITKFYNKDSVIISIMSCFNMDSDELADAYRDTEVNLKYDFYNYHRNGRMEPAFIPPKDPYIDIMNIHIRLSEIKSYYIKRIPLYLNGGSVPIAFNYELIINENINFAGERGDLEQIVKYLDDIFKGETVKITVSSNTQLKGEK